MEETNNILSIVAIVISVATTIIGVINHKRLRSTCGKKVFVAAIDIENTSPPKLNECPPGPK